MAAKKTPTYEEIKNAVFYSQQKPELLAGIIADVVGATGDSTPTTPATPETSQDGNS